MGYMGFALFVSFLDFQNHLIWRNPVGEKEIRWVFVAPIVFVNRTPWLHVRFGPRSHWEKRGRESEVGFADFAGAKS